MSIEKEVFSYHKYDGSIEFFFRLSCFIDRNHKVLDLGAGRGSWFYDDPSYIRKSLRDIKNKCKEYIGLDIDESVLENQTTHKNFIMKENNPFPFKDKTFDVIICDYVFEHINNPGYFTNEINRVLKVGGLVCGRTPHNLNYIVMISKILPRFIHNFIIQKSQPNRKQEDIFKSYYKLNTKSMIKKYFKTYYDHSYIYVSEPTYYFSNKYFFRIFSYFHKILPEIIVGNIFFFLIKK